MASISAVRSASIRQKILFPCRKKNVLFHAVPEKDMVSFSVRLFNGTSLLYSLSRRKHWWLAGFSMGCYSVPELLKMEITISFGNRQMMHAFLGGMKRPDTVQARSAYVVICLL
nr:DUF4474 domain-containing protein [[Clostridium] hylemonae]